MTESLLLLLALAAIGAAAWFAYRSAGVEPIRAERDRAVTELATLRQDNVRLAADLAAAKASTEGRSESEEARFLALAAKALESSQQTFMHLAKETFEKHSQAAAGGVKEVLAPAQEQLAKLASSVEALDKSRLQDKSSLAEHLRNLNDEVKQQRNVTGKLVSALRQSPKARGRWGEHSLRNALEMGGLSPKVDFEEQATIEGDEGKLRPDVVIRVPGGRSIVVDSKVAISAFLDAIEASDEAARDILLKKHSTELRAHMKALSAKEYWRHLPNTDTVDFVVMYVPGDNIVHEAFDRDPSLQDDAFSAKVIIAGPSGVVALARLIAYGWRQEQSARSAQEIVELGRELHRRLVKMSDLVADVGKSIAGSVKSYGALVGSIESRVYPQVRRFKELGVADPGLDVVDPPEVAAPRLPAPPEQLELMPPQAGAKRGR